MNADDLHRALDKLADDDPELADGLALVGYPPPRQRAPGFDALLSIIIGQQVSTGAAAAIRGRIEAAIDPVTPAALLSVPAEVLKQCGLSRRKVEYATGLAQAVVSGELDLDALAILPEDEAVKRLVALRGIGRWTAEIYLLFALGRSDVFPAGDLALQVALQRLRKLDDRPNETLTRDLTQVWRPHRGAAAIFLWHYYRGAPE